MTSKELREKYLNFFKSKGHAIVPSASLIPENDPSTLFVGSGMQPMAPYLLGEEHPEGARVADSQKCFRQIDIEEVGDNRHNTFFEMLGNWSLGDYFKKEQLAWIFEFLTKELKLDPQRLYVSVYRGNKNIGIDKDKESVAIWKELFIKKGIDARDIDFAEKDGMQDGRIFYYDDEKNWWSRAGVPSNMPVGEPGGPDSEIFYDLGAGLKQHENSPFKKSHCHINCDCGRFIEIGNNVFMEHIKTKAGFDKLPQKNVDFGGGLERMVMAAQGKTNIFETDLFSNVINKIGQLSGDKKYCDNIRAFEIIADHLRAVTFIIGDDNGVTPSNIGQGYIVRRLIRRAIRYGKQIGIDSKDYEGGWTKETAKIVAHDYADVYPELRKNIEFITDQLKEEEMKFSKTLERGLKVFEKEIKDKFKLPSGSAYYTTAEGLKNTRRITGEEAFNLYQTYGFPIEMTIEIAKEKGIEVDEIDFQKELKKHQELSRTASAGKFKGGLADAGEKTIKLHTAAHLLLASLRKVLGNHVFQKGSNITEERLRFDFSHSDKMTDEEKNAVEKLINDAIQKDLAVTVEEMSLDEAKKQGAMGVFESKYREKVKVYTIGQGSEIISKEICGGPHVEKTGKLGNFIIKKEESSSRGVRRIKAILE